MSIIHSITQLDSFYFRFDFILSLSSFHLLFLPSRYPDEFDESILVRTMGGNKKIRYGKMKNVECMNIHIC